jgi:hypothetical protein
MTFELKAPASPRSAVMMTICRRGPSQRMPGVLGAADQVAQQLGHLVGVRPRRQDTLLGAAQLGGSHQLHGARDLLRRLDGADPPLDVAERRHARRP